MARLPRTPDPDPDPLDATPLDATALDTTANRPLIVDELSNRLEQFRILYDSDENTDQILSELGGQGRVEREMVRELAATRTLARPERFFDAHAVAMRALEVLARNGARPPSQLRVGVLTPVAKFLVQQVIRFIVRSYQSQVFDAVRDLYSRRLAWMAAGDPSRMTVVRARLDVERAAPAFKKKAGGVPAFLVGGAAVSSLTQGVRGLASAAGGSRVGLVVAGLITFVLLAAISWVVLHGAAIAAAASGWPWTVPWPPCGRRWAGAAARPRTLPACSPPSASCSLSWAGC